MNVHIEISRDELNKTFNGFFEYHIQDHDYLYRITKCDTEIYNAQIPCHALTPSGKELYAFINYRKNKDYLGVLAEFLKQSSGGRLSCARILDRTGDEYRIGPWIDVEPRILSKQK